MMVALRSLLPLACLLALTACGEESAVTHIRAPKILRHEFGTIPHGKTEIVDLVLPLDPDLMLIPISYSGDCSCARGELVIRDSDGNERSASGRVEPRFAVREGDTAILRLRLDTAKREAVDQPIIESRGEVRLQPLNAAEHALVQIGVIFTFGVDCPITVLPKAVVNYGQLAISQGARLSLRLRGDDPALEFVAAECPNTRVNVALRKDETDTLLDVAFQSDGRTLGPFEAMATVITNTGYTLPIPVVGEVVPDLTAVPGTLLSLGNLDFRKPWGKERFLTIMDRSPRREPEFVIDSVLDQNGADASNAFVATLRPVAGDARRTQIVVTYAGGYENPEFRGTVRVRSGNGEDSATIDITVVAFHRP